MTAGLRTCKDAELEEISFTEGDVVDIIQEWQHFWLVKDADGHYYNLPKDCVLPG